MARMTGFYTLATWHVRAGMAHEFIRAWTEMGHAFATAAPVEQVTGTLIRRTDDSHRFVSFGPWPDADVIGTVRQDPAAAAAMRRVMDLCVEALPATFEVVKVLDLQGRGGA